MKIGEVVRFQEERFFNGAVQLGWVQQQRSLASEVARAFVFHGPRYHGVDEADGDDLQSKYRLLDTASFLRNLLRVRDQARSGREINPFWLAIAGYGSGKSHLSVTLAELLSDPGGATAGAVIGHLRHADADIGAETETLLAAQGKPMLLVPLDGSAGSFHLGAALSRTVFSQLARAGVDADPVRALSPRFETASEFVERNGELRAASFARHLPGQDALAIRTALANQDEDTFDAVNAVYLEANGHPIPIEGQESAQALLETLATHYCGEQGPFSHVLVLFDELGLYLEHAAEHPERAGARGLQEIFQGVQDHRSRIHFLGFIQYELKAYLQRFSGSDLRHLQRYLTRFDGADKAYLSTNLETLFAHLMHKDEGALDRLWVQADAQRSSTTTWQRLSLALPGFTRLSPWREQSAFARVIARGCWPLHPMAVWLLTRQSDLIQQRSALAFVKQATTALAGTSAIQDGRVLRVGAAELLHDHMLEQFASGDREPGGTIETLVHLLEKHSARLDRPMQLVLTAVAVLETLRVERQTRDAMDALLCEATVLPDSTVELALAALVNMGALDWNDDLAQYELLSDGASRGQFQQWLRAQAAQFTRSEVQNLFVRRGIVDCNLKHPVTTDFGSLHDIKTPDWRFDAVSAQSDTLEQSITQAFQDWRQARLPDTAKGRLIYVFEDAEDDPRDIDERVSKALSRELAKHATSIAPVWVVVISDYEGTLGGALARLTVLDERASTADKDRYRRFIDEERRRIEDRIHSAADEAMRQRRDWVAGFSEAPTDPLRKSALAIFKQVYPGALPFPFDGFSTNNGNGPRDLSTIAKHLIMREVNQAWISVQTPSRRNRIKEVVLGSWRALDETSEPCVPRQPALRSAFETLESTHKGDPERSLAASFNELIAPPHGMSAASATLVLALMIGLSRPQRALLLDGTPINAAEWVSVAFPRAKVKHYFDESVLARTRLQFFDEDSETRWRRFLDDWDAEQRIDRIASFGKQAQERLRNDPLPPSLAERLARLSVEAERANEHLLKITMRLRDVQRGIEQALMRESIHHCLKFGHEMKKIRDELSQQNRWPQTLVQECDDALLMASELIKGQVMEWIPRQTARTVAQAGDYRHRSASQVQWLEQLGFPREARALQQQAASVLHRLDDLQKHSLTLAQAQEYPLQAAPRGNESAVALREEAKRGQEIAASLAGIRSLTEQERKAHIAAIERRIAQLQTVIAQQERRVTEVSSMQITNEEELREIIASVEHLRGIFSGDRNEDYINELARHLRRIRDDLDAWEGGALSPERLSVLIAEQIDHQLSSFHAWIDADGSMDPPPWDLPELYASLAEERVSQARRRSEEWTRPRLRSETQIPALSLAAARQLHAELDSAPIFLSDTDRAALSHISAALQAHIGTLEAAERQGQISAWRGRFPDPDAVGSLEKEAIAALLNLVREPSAPLGEDDLAWQEQMTQRLNARLDQLSLDDLLARITQLSPPLRRQLMEHLQRLT